MPRSSRSRLHPLFGHPSLMQSPFVQSRLRTAHAQGLKEVIVRRFDDGHDLHPLPPTSASLETTPSQYDVLASNPDLDLSRYQQHVASASATAPALGGGEDGDVTTANPSFNPALYGAVAEPGVGSGREPLSSPFPPAVAAQVLPPRPAGLTPARARTTPEPGPGERPQPLPSPRANPFTARQLDQLVTDADFRADLDAILNHHPADPSPPRAEPGAVTAPPRGSARAASADSPPARPMPDKPNEHEIFDKIAENMRFATAYELPSVSLSRRFDSFDREQARRTSASQPRAQPNGRRTMAAEVVANPPSPSVQSPLPEGPQQQPPPTQTLRPHKEAELVVTYGDPRPDPESWMAQHVVPVPIPQLIGVPGPDGSPSDGNVPFHRLGMEALRDLFNAWQQAGLMAKVLRFAGAHGRQSPHGTGVDAHDWAIAFDILANWEPQGDGPGWGEGALAEFVRLANQHGFVWGGHDPRDQSALHFELGHQL
jgi:hypothetical protein